jgi:hypothetical protein
VGASDGLRLLFSLGSIGRKLTEYAKEIAGEPSNDRIRHKFCEKRQNILLAVVPRKEGPIDAFVVEINSQGQLYQPRNSWSSDDARDLWRNGAKLVRGAEGSFVRPFANAGVVPLCIWANLSSEGESGVALVRDMSRTMAPIEYFPFKPGRDEAQWYRGTAVEDMQTHGLARKHGSAIAAPVLVKAPNAQSTNERTCIGAVIMVHDEPSYFCTPEHIVWAQECGNLLGVLYELCRDRLSELSAFTDWQALDKQLNHDKGEPAGKDPSRIDCEKIADDIERIRRKHGMKLADAAEEMDISERTLRLLLNEHKATYATMKKAVAFILEYLPERSPDDYPLPPDPER